MKALVKTIIILAMTVMPGAAFASAERPFDSGDTIPAVPRCNDYYYTKWLDDCPYYRPAGVVDSCVCFLYQLHNSFGDAAVAKWERARGRMRVKGLVAMLQDYNPPTDDSATIVQKLPEYLYLYQLVGRHHAFLQTIEDGVDFVLVDSVRWDTATARVMELRRGWTGQYTRYCYLYEAYFEHPVYVDSDFYIFGSTNSNYPGAGRDGIIPSVYVDIVDFHDYLLQDGKICDMANYQNVMQEPFCEFSGGYCAITDQLVPQVGWYTPWPLSPIGYYLSIVDQWNLGAAPNDVRFGEVRGGGRWPDDSYDTLRAVAHAGYTFLSWNDGNTDNPRVIHLTSDTNFVAIFYANQAYNLSAVSSDETAGTVIGGGRYNGETDHIITARPNYGYKFLHWNDGITDTSRVVHLVSDTTFTAYFAVKARYNVQTATNNSEWGSVHGGGVYLEGDEATLTVSTAQFCVFDGWSDGEWRMPRTVTVTQDTLFTAILSFDSAWAAGLDMAGTLDFTVSPNPTTGQLTIRLDQPGMYETAIFDINGKTLWSGKNGDSTFDVNLGPLPAGQYLLMVRTKGKYGIKTIVKK